MAPKSMPASSAAPRARVRAATSRVGDQVSAPLLQVGCPGLDPVSEVSRTLDGGGAGFVDATETVVGDARLGHLHIIQLFV